jgi:hypothetical protein
MPRISRILLILANLAIIESLLRLLFFYLGTRAGAQLITPPPPAAVMAFINVFSLLLGIMGLLVIPELLLLKSWGYWGTVALCVLTIGFDGWAMATYAWTAGAGLVIPTLLVTYLALKGQPLHRRMIKGIQVSSL